MKSQTTSELQPYETTTSPKPSFPVLPKPDLTEGDLAEWITALLDGILIYNAVDGWMMWNGKVWESREVSEIRGLVLDTFKGMQKAAKAQGLDKAFKGRIRKLRSNGRVKAVTELMQSTCFRHTRFFNENPDYLNVQNGIVDLRTGELIPHEKEVGCTKIARVEYQAEATHADWATALTALDEDVADWLQVVMGQALTGYSPGEDRITFMTGGGSNGKSSIINGVTEALDNYVIHASEKAIMANPWDHPTEKMQFRGARFAFVEELPSGNTISGKRLKDLTGRKMTARGIARDNVTWTTTHTLFITTNHALVFDSGGHSIERRFQEIQFSRQYRENPDLASGELPIDVGLRSRIQEGKTGQHEAVLAWLIEGARRWYENDKKIPEPPQSIQEKKKAWQEENDMLGRFFDECITFDPEYHVTFADLIKSFNEYVKSRGANPWLEEEFRVAFEARSSLEKKRVRVARTRSNVGRSVSPFPIPHSTVAQPMCWFGMKFK